MGRTLAGGPWSLGGRWAEGVGSRWAKRRRPRPPRGVAASRGAPPGRKAEVSQLEALQPEMEKALVQG